jgi:hypothetical protein
VSALRIFPSLALFIDVNLGAAWLSRSDVFFAGRAAFGIQIPFVGEVSAPRSMHIKLGCFVELIADDVNAEPLGLNVALGVTL